MGTHNAVKRASSGKQSALKKLRTALSKAGITGPKASAGKQAKQAKRRAQKDARDERRTKLQSIQSTFNPYELQINRKKLDVLGLKRKDAVVNVAQARQRAVERRKETLGKERALRGRRGGIVDQRIGENDATMDPEERMLRRFTAERQKRGAGGSGGGGGGGGGLFNLEDSDVEEGITSLTHYGRSLDDAENLNDFVGSDYGDDEGIGATDVAGSHFGGFEPAADGAPARKKTKAEVMQEIIAKSKMHKHERQVLRDQDDGVRQELDDDFDAVRALLFANRDQPRPAAAAAPQDAAEEAYDAHVRNLAFEKRARPQDRLKTEEEQARAELERLERAERHRIRRLDGLPSDSESDSDASDDAMPRYKTAAKRRAEADDLGDDFGAAAAEDHTAEVSLGAGLSAAQDSASEGEGEGEESEGEESGGEESADEADGSDLDESADDEPDTAASAAALPAKRAAAAAAGGAAEELPYTFAAPGDYDAWVELAGAYSVAQQLVVIRRLRTQYHLRLAPQNKDKLAALAIILVQHVAVLSAQDPPVTGAAIDELAAHIGALAGVDAERFGEHCRQEVIAMHGRIAAGIRADGGEGLRASDLALMRL
ncbi:nucleolar complex protein 14, partial [Coemansia nantahalensis]